MNDEYVTLKIKTIHVSEQTFKNMTKGFMELKDEFKVFSHCEIKCDNNIPTNSCKVIFNHGLSTIMNLEV